MLIIQLFKKIYNTILEYFVVSQSQQSHFSIHRTPKRVVVEVDINFEWWCHGWSWLTVHVDFHAKCFPKDAVFLAHNPFARQEQINWWLYQLLKIIVTLTRGQFCVLHAVKKHLQSSPGRQLKPRKPDNNKYSDSRWCITTLILVLK